MSDGLKIIGEKLYFVSSDYKLYSISLNNDTTELESNGPIDMPCKENYEILGKDIYSLTDPMAKFIRRDWQHP